MRFKKGYSLIEVLISLLLVSSMALVLLQQQGYARYLVRQFNKQIQERQERDSWFERGRTSQ